MLFHKLRRIFAALFFEVTYVGTLGLLASYFGLSYLLMLIAGESEILQPENFIYWIAVTASTVGYGDLSPVSPLGKVFAFIFIIPVGLSLFAFLVAKVGFYISETALKGKRGLRMLETKNHTLIIGWNDQRTLRLIDLLLNCHETEVSQTIVLCVARELENPLPGRIGFVRVESFSHLPTMKRTNLGEASRILIDTPMDDVTMTTALFCDEHAPNAHVTAYFNDESIGALLQTHCPKVECVPSVSIEMMAKSTVDPGSSMLHKQLLDSTEGMTQFSLEFAGNSRRFEELFTQFKARFDSTLIGVKKRARDRIDLNPAMGYQIEQGDVLFYISAARIPPDGLAEF